MTAPIFSLLAVTIAFSALLWWVYNPRRKSWFEDQARALVLDDNTSTSKVTRTSEESLS